MEIVRPGYGKYVFRPDFTHCKPNGQNGEVNLETVKFYYAVS